MKKRRVNLSWSASNPGALFDLRKKEFYLYFNDEDRKQLHALYGGKVYYESRTGRTGAGYSFIPTSFIKINTYRKNFYNIIEHNRHVYPLTRYIKMSIYVPCDLEEETITFNHNNPAVILFNIENIEKQIILGFDSTYDIHRFFDELKEYLSEIRYLDELIEAVEKTGIKVKKMKINYTTKFASAEYYFYTSVSYNIARKIMYSSFLEEYNIKIDHNYLNDMSDEMLDFYNFFNIAKTNTGHLVLLDSFNKRIVRKYIKNIFFQTKENIEKELEETVEILQDGKEGVWIATKGKGKGKVAKVMAYTKVGAKEIELICEYRTYNRIYFELYRDDIISSLTEEIKNRVSQQG